jgi:TonB-like protein
MSSVALRMALLGVIAVPAHAADAIHACSPPPSFVKMVQPVYPPDVELRGFSSPVWLIVEFVVAPDGRASQARIIESDAGVYEREFSVEAIQTVNTMRFKQVPRACRSRMKIVFKIAD